MWKVVLKTLTATVSIIKLFSFTNINFIFNSIANNFDKYSTCFVLFEPKLFLKFFEGGSYGIIFLILFNELVKFFLLTFPLHFVIFSFYFIDIQSIDSYSKLKSRSFFKFCFFFILSVLIRWNISEYINKYNLCWFKFRYTEYLLRKQNIYPNKEA